MYVITLTYTASLERIDEALEGHRAFLDRHFESGIFIAAGARVPREGGVILATRVERSRLDQILASDPFAQQKLARYDVIEFNATRTAKGLNLPGPV